MISETLGIEGKKVLTPEDDYQALIEFTHSYEGTKTADRGPAPRVPGAGAGRSGTRGSPRAPPGLAVQWPPGGERRRSTASSSATGCRHWTYVLGKFTLEAGLGAVVLRRPRDRRDLGGRRAASPATSDPRSKTTPHVWKRRAHRNCTRQGARRHIKNTYLKRIDAPVARSRGSSPGWRSSAGGSAAGPLAPFALFPSWSRTSATSSTGRCRRTTSRTCLRRFDDDVRTARKTSASTAGTPRRSRHQASAAARASQPWGVFFVMFEPRRLPVVALRTHPGLRRPEEACLGQWFRPGRMGCGGSALHLDLRGGGRSPDQLRPLRPTLPEDGVPTLNVLGWDNRDTPLHLDRGRGDADAAPAVAGRSRTTRTPGGPNGGRRSRCGTARSSPPPGNCPSDLQARERALASDHDRPCDRDRTGSRQGPDDGIPSVPSSTTSTRTNSRTCTRRPSRTGSSRHASQVPTLARVAIWQPTCRSRTRSSGTAGDLPCCRGKARRRRRARSDFDELGVSDVIQLLDDANMEAVVRDFGDQNPDDDPVIHFYELFLKEYDAKRRMQRGVFYTPRPVVSYIVRSVDELLRTRFGLVDGLADTSTWGELHARIPGLEFRRASNLVSLSCRSSTPRLGPVHSSSRSSTSFIDT